MEKAQSMGNSRRRSGELLHRPHLPRSQKCLHVKFLFLEDLALFFTLKWIHKEVISTRIFLNNRVEFVACVQLYLYRL